MDKFKSFGNFFVRVYSIAKCVDDVVGRAWKDFSFIPEPLLFHFMQGCVMYV